jgi:hypothetical protein
MSTDQGQRTAQHDSAGGGAHMTGLAGRLAFAWAFVGIPLAYGVYETAKKAAALFTG